PTARKPRVTSSLAVPTLTLLQTRNTCVISAKPTSLSPKQQPDRTSLPPNAKHANPCFAARPHGSACGHRLRSHHAPNARRRPHYAIPRSARASTGWLGTAPEFVVVAS